MITKKQRPRKSLAARRAATAAANKARQTPLPAAITIDADGDGIRLLAKAEVVDRVGADYSTIYRWMKNGTFPRSRSMAGKTVWVAAEVDAWIRTLPQSRLKGDGGAAA